MLAPATQTDYQRAAEYKRDVERALAQVGLSATRIELLDLDPRPEALFTAPPTFCSLWVPSKC